METLILIIIVAVVLRAIASPAVPMPRYNPRKVKRQLYSPREGIPFAWFSRKRAEKFRALKERVDAETAYVESVRKYERTRRR